MAEGEGFEPSKDVTTLTRLAGGCTRPLCDPSDLQHITISPDGYPCLWIVIAKSVSLGWLFWWQSIVGILICKYNVSNDGYEEDVI